MTEQTPAFIAESAAAAEHDAALPARGISRIRSIALPVIGFALALFGTLLCRAAAGISLGLFFGGLGFATILVPPIVGGETRIARRVLACVAVTLGVAAAWLTAFFDSGASSGDGGGLTFMQWAACVVALLAFALALCGLCSFLIDWCFNPHLASAVVVLVALAWLTWPVWLAHALQSQHGDTIVAWLVPAHPLFAINGVLPQFDAWDRHPLAYTRLTVLNQDVFYSMPAGVLWTVVIHGAIAGAMLILCRLLRRGRA
jgi:hypothetical protein